MSEAAQIQHHVCFWTDGTVFFFWQGQGETHQVQGSDGASGMMGQQDAFEGYLMHLILLVDLLNLILIADDCKMQHVI